jgi:phosphotriesterase-related protein
LLTAIKVQNQAHDQDGGRMIQTVTGPVHDSDFGRAAAHEHILVDFHDPAEPPRAYDRSEVIAVIRPYLEKLREAGCRGFVDCTPIWLGRDPLVLQELSQQTGLNIITNTGWYQAPMLPPEACQLTEREIAALWIDEAENGIGSTGIKPGFIKIALNSGKLSDISQKILKSAILAAKASKLAIVSHTVGCKAMLEAQVILNEQKFDLSQFIWAHADAADGREIQIQMAASGVWISLDGIGSRHDQHAAMLKDLINAGLADRVLISQDSGWYHIGEPNGGEVRPYHTLFSEFIPYAIQSGINKKIIDQIITINVAKALRVRSLD